MCPGLMKTLNHFLSQGKVYKYGPQAGHRPQILAALVQPPARVTLMRSEGDGISQFPEANCKGSVSHTLKNNIRTHRPYPLDNISADVVALPAAPGRFPSVTR